jgi:hypothetical protein
MAHRRSRRHVSRSPRRYYGGRSDVVYVEPYQIDNLITCPPDCKCCHPREAGLDINEVPPPEVHRPKVYEAGLMTEAELENYIETTNGTIVSVHTVDMMPNAAKFPTSFLKAWSDFLDRWRVFYVKNKIVTTIFGMSLSSLSDQVDAYVKELKSFSAQAGILAGFKPSVVIQDPIVQSNPVKDTFKVVTGLAILAGIVVFGPTIVKSFSSHKGE